MGVEGKGACFFVMENKPQTREWKQPFWLFVMPATWEGRAAFYQAFAVIKANLLPQLLPSSLVE